MTVHRAMSVSAAAVLVAGLVSVLPAGAAQATSKTEASTTVTPDAAAKRCAPALDVLGSLPRTDAYNSVTDGVRDLGVAGLAVGAAQSRPVYWTGSTIHRVPLPTGYTQGEVLAVNKHGLMVGTIMDPVAYVWSAFSYRPGDAAVRLLPGGASATDVNDSGVVVGVPPMSLPAAGLEWQGGALRRELPVPDGSTVDTVTAINNKGAVTGSAVLEYTDPATGLYTWRSIPLVWPTSGSAPHELRSTGEGLYEYSVVKGIDESGHVVGYDWLGPSYQWTPWTWARPYPAAGSSPGVLATHAYGTFEAISPRTDVVVGTAKSSSNLAVQPDQAQLWTGAGPLRALPRLAPAGASSAMTVTDDGRVGGAAADASGVTRPVIWTCALQQAYVPKVGGY